MTDSQPKLAHGDKYLVIYIGGPNDGRTDERISTDGRFDEEITVLTAVGGKETMTAYSFVDYNEIGGEYHVNYAYDATDSEPVDAPEDRGDRQ